MSSFQVWLSCTINHAKKNKGLIIQIVNGLHCKVTSEYVRLLVPLAAITSPRERMAPHSPNDPYVIRVWSLEARRQRSKPTKSSFFTCFWRYSSANLTSLYLAKFSYKGFENICSPSLIVSNLYPVIIITEGWEDYLIRVLVVSVKHQT